MTKDKLKSLYFEWMYRLVCSDQCLNNLSYRKLLDHLNSVDFTYTLPMDGNREADGINLRYRFGYECSYDDVLISVYLDDRPCSVLEMMIALVMRCEEHIMDDPNIGDRTGYWFWNMVISMGLDMANDRYYDNESVDEVIFRFLNREYKSNGEGGLFIVNNPKRDMRQVEIWYQMCWYLSEIVTE